MVEIYVMQENPDAMNVQLIVIVNIIKNNKRGCPKQSKMPSFYFYLLNTYGTSSPLPLTTLISSFNENTGLNPRVY